ncbi:putative vesicle transport protein, Use1 [Helianthus annuus]|nr:putative vesicle transport protein, Use1 [Helianthus annuus]
MGLSRTEINLKRLLAAAPHQQNKLKLMHYVATLREQLEEIALERTAEGFPRLKIEAIAANLASPVSDAVALRELRVDTSVKENINNKKDEESITSPGLRRRLV